MHWTNEKPTEPGCYWWRYDRHSTPCFISVQKIDDDLYAWCDALGYEKVKKWNGQWAGPLPEPTEE